jgi:hypothetical protein
MTITTDLRNADLPTLVSVLRDQHARRYDVVVPASSLAMQDDGTVSVIHTTEPTIDENGVTPGGIESYACRATEVADEHLGERCDIPRRYYKKLRADAPSLLATNVNHWLQADTRRVFVRAFRGDDGEMGILRAVRSDRFQPYDALDVVVAALQGIHATGLVDPQDLEIRADLSSRRMYVRVNAPTITRECPELVQSYRDPRTGRTGTDYGVVSAGFELRDSDVGEGALSLSPRIEFLVCKNGLTRTQDGMRSVHLGGAKDTGVIDWSAATLRKTMDVITSKTSDAVRTFLSPGYLDGVISELRGFADAKIGDPLAIIEEVAKKMVFSQDEQAMILSAFIAGGDVSALGVAQAITSVAQSDDISADRAATLSDSAWPAMVLAAR